VLPDRFIDHDSQTRQIAEAGLAPKNIVAAVMGALGIATKAVPLGAVGD
jgi:hypothetical protein